MKELSIEQKAIAYDKTIEKLRKFYRDYDTISCLIDVKEELANLFPELKECHESIDPDILIQQRVDALTQLEKQKQKSTDTYNSSTINGKEFPAGEKRDFGYFSEPTNKEQNKVKL